MLSLRDLAAVLAHLLARPRDAQYVFCALKRCLSILLAIEVADVHLKFFSSLIRNQKLKSLSILPGLLEGRAISCTCPPAPHHQLFCLFLLLPSGTAGIGGLREQPLEGVPRIWQADPRTSDPECPGHSEHDPSHLVPHPEWPLAHRCPKHPWLRPSSPDARISLL